MAEGGSPDDQSSDDTTASDCPGLIDVSIMNCPICLRQLEQPRSLPCLHTFCENCLKSCILSTPLRSSFPCPYCRATTKPRNDLSQKIAWAAEFPMNNLVIEILKHNERMRRESDASRKVRKQCETHGDNVTKLCGNHKQLCCMKCEKDSHSGCKDVKLIEDFCKILGETPEVDGVKTILKNLENLINNMQKQKCDLHMDQQTALEKIFEVSKTMNMYLETLSEKLFETQEAQQDRIEMNLQLCEQLRSSIQDTQDSPQTSVDGADYLEKILRYQSMCKQIKFAEDVVTQIKKSQRHFRVQYLTDTSHANLVQCLGRIDVQEGQIPHAEFVLSFSTALESDTKNCDILGIGYLPGGYVVVSDYGNSSVKLFTDGGNILDERKMSGRPYDICVINHITIGVVQYYPSTVYVFKVEDQELSQVSEVQIKDEEDCSGLTYTDGKFIFSTDSEKVLSVSENGQDTTLLHKAKLMIYHLTVDRRYSHIIASEGSTDVGKTAVYRLSESNPVELLKVGLVKGAKGIDCDISGNLYVCGKESDNIVYVSSDRLNVRELLNRSDGVTAPRAISVCGDRFVISNQSQENKEKLHIYQLS